MIFNACLNPTSALKKSISILPLPKTPAKCAENVWREFARIQVTNPTTQTEAHLTVLFFNKEDSAYRGAINNI